MPRRSASSAEFATGATRLKPPPDLNELERKEFVDLVLALPADHFTAADVSTVAMYVRAVVAERRSAGELDAAPIVDGKPSPWFIIWQGQVRACTTLARRLRLNPAGFQPTTKSDPTPISVYDQMRLESEVSNGTN